MGLTAENDGAYEEDFKEPGNKGSKANKDTGIDHEVPAGNMTGTVDTTDVGAGEGALLASNTNADFGVEGPSSDLLRVDDPALSAEENAANAEEAREEAHEATAGTEDSEVNAGGEEEKASTVDDLFDPAEHTVPEVQEHLDGASASERKRVLREEKKRQPNGRAGILNYEPKSD
jgi:hypothetical protein